MAVPFYKDTIELKPPTELLSDEYERVEDKNFMVQIIYGKHHEDSANQFNTTLVECGFSVKMNPFKDFLNILATFREDVEKKRRKAGVFVIVLCSGKAGDDHAGQLFDDDGNGYMFASVWDDFIQMECLNRLPKLFLFQTHIPQPRTQYDGQKPKRLYDVAAPGADLFVICRTTSVQRDDGFIEQFCKHIKDYGDYADIFEITTFATDTDRPLIVSTLTAKFFFKKADYRQYNHQIMKGLAEIEENLKIKT